MPLIPRAQLPEEFQPHFSFYNKMVNIANGIDPTPRGERERRQNNPADIEQQAVRSEIEDKLDSDRASRKDSNRAIREAAANIDGQKVADEEKKGVELSDIKEKVPAMSGTVLIQEEEVEALGFGDADQYPEMKDYTD